MSQEKDRSDVGVMSRGEGWSGVRVKSWREG